MNNNAGAFAISARLRSVRHALDGIATLVYSQHNARLHLLATLAVLLAALWFQVSVLESCILVLAVSLVWLAEALNTAVEFVCDVASPEIHPLIKKSKDVAAAGVLISSSAALLVGLLIFIPHLV